MIKEIIIECLNVYIASLIISITLGILLGFIKTIDYNSIKSICLFIYDASYILSFTLFNTLVLYYFNNGQFRWYYLFSELLGIITYGLNLSSIIEKTINKLVKLINKKLIR